MVYCDCRVHEGQCTYPDCQTFNSAVSVVHLTPKIDETCDHQWPMPTVDSDTCKRCGLSFLRYVHSIG